ncbi:hypothetical protein MSG28_001266 [Choristoneura fumiferana]|uniref:Uncharacterized protein n=1 Tax=Choristoneura fumiferana TaxID=7141 RepID=A0ACC0K4G7_CHOFU|nr:hypothetical protein MSG28_001266 [Choristoneura fumiferana]
MEYILNYTRDFKLHFSGPLKTPFKRSACGRVPMMLAALPLWTSSASPWDKYVTALGSPEVSINREERAFMKHFISADLRNSSKVVISCLAQQNSGMNYRLRYSRTDVTFKFSRKERTPTLKAGNALVTLLALQVSMGDGRRRHQNRWFLELVVIETTTQASILPNVQEIVQASVQESMQASMQANKQASKHFVIRVLVLFEGLALLGRLDTPHFSPLVTTATAMLPKRRVVPDHVAREGDAKLTRYAPSEEDEATLRELLLSGQYGCAAARYDDATDWRVASERVHTCRVASESARGMLRGVRGWALGLPSWRGMKNGEFVVENTLTPPLLADVQSTASGVI